VVPLYAAGLAVKDGLRAVGVFKVKRLAWPVVSVGSLSAGGAGKTPVVIALADLLRPRGWNVDVLSRGYGRGGSGVARVDAGAEDAARRFGDEPVVIARYTRVPVWVGGERFLAGVAAEADQCADKSVPQRLKPQGREGVYGTAEAVPLSETEGSRESLRRVHLLDDGFQHRRLARAVDVVVVTAEDLDDALLPAGNRREGLGALRRADVIVLREEERNGVEARVRGLMREGAVVWSVRRRLMLPVAAERLSSGPRPVAFCAIARPEGFWAMLKEAGCDVVEKVEFGDHHAYSVGDVDSLVERAKGCNASGFLTTAKDHVKLSRAMMDRLREVGPVDVLKLEARFVDEAGVVRDLEARI
jgi:tetraacyldisaccharide 4'-kinase